MSKIKAEYIWMDGHVPTQKLRSKTKVLNGPVNSLDDLPLWGFDGSGYYVKSSEEMRKLFPQDKYPDACNNTIAIADRVNYEFNFDNSYLPDSFAFCTAHSRPWP